MKRYTIYIILLLVALLSASFFLIYQSKQFISRASLTPTTFSIDNSYVFATPLRAQANGEEKIRVTVLVLNNQGLGVLGRKVKLGKLDNTNIEIISNSDSEGNALTDQQGKAIFDISTKSAGTYYSEVSIEGSLLPQKVQLTFY